MAITPRLSMYAREHIRQMICGDASVVQVVEALKAEGIITCRQTVWRLQQHIVEHSTVDPLPKSGCPTKLTATV